ncbi:MAG TPA: nitrate reductase subunit beta [Acidimicrobiia bacterium]|nr:nitrate reductase subunit beta [Acidimicrobiia bacterium]
MRVRAQMSMLFHLDKCIGCHTCSVACKNLWTDRKGAEYMWWNNVETRPGTGYPTGWEDQEHYQGGWHRDEKGRLKLVLHSRPQALSRLFFNPALPELDDYYEPFTFRYQDLFDSPQGDQQPTARPISMITGDDIDIRTGPNWDDDLGGSDIYARNDLSMEGVGEEVRAQMEEIERVVFNYLPRICNHCLNPACVAACPSGAIYKRSEDGVVLVNEDKCRAWRMCVAACPYKKVYYNWATGKSEKCILCFPRMEIGQAPACAHSCVGRIRYMGVLLYDQDRIATAASAPRSELLAAQLDAILDPWDETVVTAAKAAGIDEGSIDAARRSPAWKFVKEWGLALPLHPEYRTMAMMFYIPPLSPVVSTIERNLVRLDLPPERVDFELFDELDKARLPLQYLANLFSAGDEEVIRRVLRKMLAVRIYKRRQSVDGLIDASTLALLDSAGTSEGEVEAIYRLTTLPTVDERFVFPPYHREMAIEDMKDPLGHKGEAGLGYLQPPLRGA